MQPTGIFFCHATNRRAAGLFCAFIFSALLLGSLLHGLALTGAAAAPAPAAAALEPAHPADSLPLTLHVAVSADYPPMEYLDNGQIVGHDITLMNAIAAELGLPVEYTNVPFNQLIGALQDGLYDAVISSLSITPARQQRIDYSLPYTVFGADDEVGIAVQKDDHTLRRAINGALQTLQQNGFLADLIADIAADQPAWNPHLATWRYAGLNTDGAEIFDHSFNELAYLGLLRAETAFPGLVGTVYTATNPSVYTQTLAACAADGNEICVSVGFMMPTPTWNAAQMYTATNFVVLDASWDGVYPPNLRGALMAVDEAAYLAGVLSAYMSGGGIVGAVGGWTIPPVDLFIDGFAQGALCANPQVQTLITYTFDFDNPTLGAQAAQNLMSQGADVIFGVAGRTGAGALLTATQSGAWAVGVDVDEYMTTFANGAMPGNERLLTSVLKKLDNLAFYAYADQWFGAFTSGTRLYNLAESGTGLAPFHAAEASIPSVVLGRLARLEDDLTSGRISVGGDCPGYMTPATATIPDQGTTIITASQGLVELIFEPGVFSEPAVITYTPLLPQDPGYGLAGTGTFFYLEAVAQADGAPLAPQQPYTLTVAFSLPELHAAGIYNPLGLRLYSLVGREWVLEPTSTVNLANLTVSATPDHFSTWALLAPDQGVFVPVVFKP